MGCTTSKSGLLIMKKSPIFENGDLIEQQGDLYFKVGREKDKFGTKLNSKIETYFSQQIKNMEQVQNQMTMRESSIIQPHPTPNQVINRRFMNRSINGKQMISLKTANQNESNLSLENKMITLEEKHIKNVHNITDLSTAKPQSSIERTTTIIKFKKQDSQGGGYIVQKGKQEIDHFQFNSQESSIQQNQGTYSINIKLVAIIIENQSFRSNPIIIANEKLYQLNHMKNSSIDIDQTEFKYTSQMIKNILDQEKELQDIVFAQ
eukprot:403365809